MAQFQSSRKIGWIQKVCACVVVVQSDISELERTRESMARELVSVCIQNEDLAGKLSYHETLQQKHSVRQHTLCGFFVPLFLSLT